jgi:hypothetical protein
VPKPLRRDQQQAEAAPRVALLEVLALAALLLAPVLVLLLVVLLAR